MVFHPSKKQSCWNMVLLFLTFPSVERKEKGHTFIWTYLGIQALQGTYRQRYSFWTCLMKLWSSFGVSSAALFSWEKLFLWHHFTCTEPAKPCYAMPNALIWLLYVSCLTLPIWKLPFRNVFLYIDQINSSVQICRHDSLHLAWWLYPEVPVRISFS